MQSRGAHSLWQGNIWQCLCMEAGERGRASSVEQQMQKTFLTLWLQHNQNEKQLHV